MIKIRESARTAPRIPKTTEITQGWNCSSSNPYFVGWQNQYNVVAWMLYKAWSNGLSVTELDGENELDPNFSTVEARLILDNAHPQTGNPDNVNSLRYYMVHCNPSDPNNPANCGFDPGRVIWSAYADRTLVAGTTCYDVIRTMPVCTRSAGWPRPSAAVISAHLISIQRSFSNISQPTCAAEDRFTVQQAKRIPPACSSSQAILPSVWDTHDYPCVANSTGCYSDEPHAQVQSEATKEFSAMVQFMAIVGTPSALYIVGETHGNSNQRSNSGCEGNQPYDSAYQTVLGYNNSAIAGHTSIYPGEGVVFRPWFDFAGGSQDCYSYPADPRINVNNQGPYTPTH